MIDLAEFGSNKSIANIESTDGTIKQKDGFFTASFEFTDFYDSKAYLAFIRGVEKLVRTSDEYDAYKDYLMNEIGLNFCAVLSNVTAEKASIEMHHGPILTLFDYCEIVFNALHLRGEKITSFYLADIILRLHFDNKIQIVMLSNTVHSLAHGSIFIHPSQAWGDLNGFFEEWGDGLTDEQITTINEYIKLSKKYETTDNDILKFSGIKKWRSDNLPWDDENFDVDIDGEIVDLFEKS